MKRFLVIGIGHFGSWVARALHEGGHEVVAVDRRTELVDRLADFVTRCVVGDGTDRELLREIGVASADAAIISTGEDLAASILATLAVKDVGIREIYVKVTSGEAARALDALGVHETIFPERESAERLAQRLPSRAVLEYIPLAGRHSIQQIAVPDEWIGKSLRELALPSRHGVNVVALLDVLTGRFDVAPDPDAPLKESDVALIAGENETINRLLGGAS